MCFFTVETISIYKQFLNSFKLVIKYFLHLYRVLKKRFKNLYSNSKQLNGFNNKLTNEGVFKNVKFDIVGDYNEIKIGKNTFIKDTRFYLRGNNHKIVIEDNCYIGMGELWIEDHHGSISIGSNTTIEQANLAVTEPFSIIEIRKNCMLSHNIEVRTGDSHSIIDLTSGERINKAANVIIHEHVWIGAHAKILKGVIIGPNSIIGIASLVTKNIQANSIAAGIPAKVIKTNINWKRERI